MMQQVAQRFWMNLARHIILASLLLIVFFLSMSTENRVPVERPQATGSPMAIIEQNDCWTGEAPADMEGKMPGHVVVTRDNVTSYAGSRMVGKALEQIFEGKDHNLEIHGFCR